MRERIVALLDRADDVIASCAVVADASELRPLIESVRNARTRLGYPEEVLVVALAGGTGSGKSSLFNEIVGDEVVAVGAVRPTTSRAAAAVPASSYGALAGYLDRLGIEDRYPSQREGICLIDLPDIDSVEEAHHLRVDQLLPKVDLVVWVTDPEKYKDARLHDDYLKPMAPSSPQLLFVLNRTDRVTADQAMALRDDLVEALRQDGIESPRVVMTAAAPTVGDPVGVDEVVRQIEDLGATRDVLYGKVLSDLEMAARGLPKGTEESTTGFDARASLVKETAEASLSSGDLARATEGIVVFLTDLAGESGGPTGDALLRLAADAPRHLVRIEGSTPVPSGRPQRWWRRRSRGPDPGSYGPALDEAIFRPARSLLAKKAVAVDAVAELASQVQNLRRETRR
ncbi:MAG TPA: GTPase [Acidimicrobiia bacterium]|nr:GTPase [Acidimicrobiia bacterium]